jgi:four helix bundle protein
MQDFKKLLVWQEGHALTLAVYAVTVQFPREEQYGLTSQLRRAASSIPANIAEGCGRDSNAELARFLRIASGSANELEYHLLLAHNLHYLGDEPFLDLMARVQKTRRMATRLLSRLHSDLRVSSSALD